MCTENETQDQESAKKTPAEAAFGFLNQYYLPNMVRTGETAPTGSVTIYDDEGNEITLDLNKVNESIGQEDFGKTMEGVLKDVTEVNFILGVGRGLNADEISALETVEIEVDEDEDEEEEETYNPQEAAEQRFLFLTPEGQKIVLSGIMAVCVLDIVNDDLSKRERVVGQMDLIPGQAVIKDKMVLVFARELNLADQDDETIADENLYEEE